MFHWDRAHFNNEKQSRDLTRGLTVFPLSLAVEQVFGSFCSGSEHSVSVE